MSTLTRYILRSLIKNYLIALAVMISLYTVLDLFFNLDEFTEHRGKTVLDVMTDIGQYYASHVFLYFSQISGVITLFACGVTLTRMRRDNELTAMLASGISLYRVGTIALAFGLGTSALWYVNAQRVIPSIAHLLARSHDDADGRETYGVWFLKDRDNALLSSIRFDPASGNLHRLLVLKMDEDWTIRERIEADEGAWVRTPDSFSEGVWRLTRGTVDRRIRHAEASLGPPEEIVGALIEEYPSDLSPQDIQLRQSTSWIQFLSSRQLERVSQSLPGMSAEVAKERHVRFATPLVGLLMLAVGIPFFLDRSPMNVVPDITKSLVASGSIYLIWFAGQNLVDIAQWPALPAWLPIMIGTPMAVVLLDRIRT